MYFPEVASSILIPPFSSRVHRVLRERQVWEVLTSHRIDGQISEEAFRIVAQLRNVNVDQLKTAFQAMDSGGPESEADELDETAFRLAEYQALHQERRDQDDLLACRPQELDAYGSIVRDFFGQEFEGDATTQANVFGLVNDAHAAATEFFGDAVMRDRLTDQ